MQRRLILQIPPQPFDSDDSPVGGDSVEVAYQTKVDDIANGSVEISPEALGTASCRVCSSNKRVSAKVVRVVTCIGFGPDVSWVWLTRLVIWHRATGCQGPCIDKTHLSLRAVRMITNSTPMTLFTRSAF